jgi:two-component system OmpR family sensor kinase
VPGTTTSGHFFVLAVGLTLRDTDATIARFAAIFIFFGLTVVIVGGAGTLAARGVVNHPPIATLREG